MFAKYIRIYIYIIIRNYCFLGFFSILIKYNKDKKIKFIKKKEFENKKLIRCIEVIMKLIKIKKKKINMI